MCKDAAPVRLEERGDRFREWLTVAKVRQYRLGRCVVPDTRSPFWTSAPGILTGLAALITALVGAFALVLSHDGESSSGSASPPAATPVSAGGSQSIPRAPSSPPTGTSHGESGPLTLTTTMQDGDCLDLDADQVGTAIDGDVCDAVGGEALQLFHGRAAIVHTETDESGCASALQQRSDNGADIRNGAILCVATDQGAVAEVRSSPPDATMTITVNATTWRH